MALHRLTSVTMGVPNVTETAAYYDEFGLVPDGDGWFTTRDGGRQLHIVAAPTHRLVDLHVGVDDHDDLARAADNLTGMGVAVHRGPHSISAVEQATGARAYLESPPGSIRSRCPRRPTTARAATNAAVSAPPG